MSASLGIFGDGERTFVAYLVDGEPCPIIECPPEHALAFLHGYSVALKVDAIGRERAISIEEIKLIVENTALDMNLENRKVKL